MQKVQLNSKQITELVKYKKTLISNNIAIEVFLYFTSSVICFELSLTFCIVFSFYYLKYKSYC